MFLSQEDVAAGFFDPYVVRAVLGYFNEKFPEKSQLTPTEFKLVVDKISPTWSTVEEVHEKSKNGLRAFRMDPLSLISIRLIKKLGMVTLL